MTRLRAALRDVGYPNLHPADALYALDAERTALQCELHTLKEER